MGLNKRQHDYWADQITSKQGGYFCYWCGVRPLTLQKHGKDPNLLIDHEDNNQNHNVLENLWWICRGCNRRKNPHKQHEPKRVLTQSESTNKKEKPWRSWVMEFVMDEGSFTTDEATYSGAEVFDVSPDTIDRRWLPKITSAAGPLIEIENKLYIRDEETELEKMKKLRALKPNEEELKKLKS